MRPRWTSVVMIACVAVAVGACDTDDDSETPPEDDMADTATTGQNVPDDDTEDPPDDDPAPPIELTPTLCDDPANMDLILPYLGGGEPPSYGEVSTEQFERMVAAPTEGPFYMVNLIRFRERAVYRDGRETELTGREANALYSPVEFLAAIGARPVFVGQVGDTTAGEDGAWEEVAVVEYPCPLALFAMSVHPEFRARSIHKDAGLERSIVMVTHVQSMGAPGPVETPFPPTAEDPSFEHVQVFRYRDEAAYPPDSAEPARSGAEAMTQYELAIAEARARVGITAKARLAVQGVYIGDGRDWDEVWVDSVPSSAALEALAQDPDATAANVHRGAAVGDAHGLAVAAQLSSIPQADAADGSLR